MIKIGPYCCRCGFKRGFLGFKWFSVKPPSIKHTEGLKKQLADLKKPRPATYEVKSEFTPSKEKHGKGKVSRRVVSKEKKEEPITPVV